MESLDHQETVSCLDFWNTEGGGRSGRRWVGRGGGIGPHEAWGQP